VLVVSLFASWCVPCRSNIPDLNIINSNLQSEVQIIGVVARENDKELGPLRQFTQVLNINFPVVWEEIGFTDSLSNLVPGLHVLPQMFIIDREGRMRKRFSGFNSKVTPALVREALDQIRAKDAMRTR
jgi:thiol-disulfide isomerase/thioredoxin